MPEPIKLYTLWPLSIFPTSFLTACFSRTQLLTLLPLPQMLSLVPALIQAAHAWGPSVWNSFSHTFTCLTDLHILEQINYTRIISLSLLLKYYTSHHSLSIFHYRPLFFYITVKAIGNVTMFNICLLVSMLSSPSRRADPWEKELCLHCLLST